MVDKKTKTKMHKAEIVEAFAKRYGYTKRSCTILYDEIAEFTIDMLKEGHDLYLKNVLTLGVKVRPPKRMMDFQTGEVRVVEASVLPYCDIRKPLKEEIKKHYRERETAGEL